MLLALRYVASVKLIFILLAPQPGSLGGGLGSGQRRSASPVSVGEEDGEPLAPGGGGPAPGPATGWAALKGSYPKLEGESKKKWQARLITVLRSARGTGHGRGGRARGGRFVSLRLGPGVPPR